MHRWEYTGLDKDRPVGRMLTGGSQGGLVVIVVGLVMVVLRMRVIIDNGCRGGDGEEAYWWVARWGQQ